MSIQEKIREFRPAILFLAKFIAIYLVGNFLYGLYVSSFRPEPDPITTLVTAQTSGLLNALGFETSWTNNPGKPTTQIDVGRRHILAVYEGCNGINVMVIFVAFVTAFGRMHKRLLWFIPVGLVLVHLANLGRLIFLFVITTRFPGYFYFTHKYLFTAAIYVMVLLLWIWWVRLVTKDRTDQAA
ncbi:MAG: exosortase family protein XrtF [Cyclobacteriaceae bacterium]